MKYTVYQRKELHACSCQSIYEQFTDGQPVLKHLFVTCPNVQLFWTEFTDWWYRKNNTVITLSEAQILYGITDTVPLCLGLNLCTIIAKYYIYTASKNGKLTRPKVP